MNDLMQQAVRIKTAQQETFRRNFDSLPKYIQNSMFQSAELAEYRLSPNSENGFEKIIQFGDELSENGKMAYQENKDMYAAYTYYEKALHLVVYLVNTAENWKKKGIHDEDIEYYDLVQTCNTGYKNAAVGTILLSDNERHELAKRKLSCCLNIAACLMKLLDYKQAILACNDALLIDKNCVKAYYRRAKCRLLPTSCGALEQEMAIGDLEKAYALDKKDPMIYRELKHQRESIKKQKRTDKQTFDGMFNRGEIVDKVVEKDNPVPDDAETKYLKEMHEAKVACTLLESRGEMQQALEIKKRIAQAEKARQKYVPADKLDFLHPTPTMIEDAKKNNLDLSDPTVQRMLHAMQMEKLGKTTTVEKLKTNPLSTVLNSMKPDQVNHLLLSEGYDPKTCTNATEKKNIAKFILQSHKIRQMSKAELLQQYNVEFPDQLDTSNLSEEDLKQYLIQHLEQKLPTTGSLLPWSKKTCLFIALFLFIVYRNMPLLKSLDTLDYDDF